MKYVILAVLAFALVGCGTVDVAAIRSRIDTYEKSVPALQAAADQLQAMAESTGKPEIIAAAANAKAALDFTVEQIPKMKAELAHLEDQAPAWKVALAAAWPIIIAGIRFIPGFGPIAAPLANIAWSVMATKKQKADDA